MTTVVDKPLVQQYPSPFRPKIKFKSGSGLGVKPTRGEIMYECIPGMKGATQENTNKGTDASLLVAFVVARKPCARPERPVRGPHLPQSKTITLVGLHDPLLTYGPRARPDLFTNITQVRPGMYALSHQILKMQE